MTRFHKLFSTCLGIGYIGKGGGTAAAVFACICWRLAWSGGYNLPLSIILTVAITFLGVWSSTIVAKEWGKDPAKVVIDEFAGMWITLIALPVNLPYLCAGLVLFRFFDIAKPLFIRRMEKFPGGWGIMFDDVLAGIYSNILLQLVLWFKLF